MLIEPQNPLLTILIWKTSQGLTITIGSKEKVRWLDQLLQH